MDSLKANDAANKIRYLCRLRMTFMLNFTRIEQAIMGLTPIDCVEWFDAGKIKKPRQMGADPVLYNAKASQYAEHVNKLIRRIRNTERDYQMNDYCKNLHEIYQLVTSPFSKTYPKANKDLLYKIDNYSRSCALYLWNLFGVGITECTVSVNQIYSEMSGKQNYTEDDVREALADISRQNHYMPIPDFFDDVIKYDVVHGTNFSRRLSNCFQMMDILYAMIDECVEEEEIDIIISMQKALIDECDWHRVAVYEDAWDPRDFIISKKQESLFVTTKKYDGNDTNDIQNYCCDKEPVKEEIINNKKSGKVKKDDVSYRSSNSGSDSMKNGTEKTPIDELNELIGLRMAKKEICEISDFARVQKVRRDMGLTAANVSYHLVFTGSPGTGKTTVARLVAKIYKELGVLSEGHLVEVSAKDLIAGYVGQTAIKTGAAIDKALGGVLFIDEAYSLLDKDDRGFGQEAIDTILKEMEDNRENFAVIVAGYDEPMHEFVNSNPGLKSRFNRYIHFEDYTSDEMYQIFNQLCDSVGYTVSNDADHQIKKCLESLCLKKGEGFANGRTVRNVFEKIIQKQAGRVAKSNELTKEALITIEETDVRSVFDNNGADSEEIDDILNELNNMSGLEQAKEEIQELVFIVKNQKRRKAQGLKVPPMSLNLVFAGNPGTGKTTVARLVARIYKSLGLLSEGQFVETDRNGLVAGYIGQTSVKTKNIVQEALGGVLFIEDAYTLMTGSENDYGQEAVDTLLKSMDDNRDNLVVILSGYEELIDAFIRSNPGLQSKFNRYIHFSDYNALQMGKIFSELCEQNQYTFDEATYDYLIDYFDGIDIASAGNVRGARSLFENVVVQQAKRIERSSEGETLNLQEITIDDISRAIGRS